MPLASGTDLDGYQIIAPLGAGGMGEVYRARDPGLKRDVAIKVLPSSVAQDPVRLQRFQQEAQAAAALNHPNILAVYRFGLYSGSPYIVSELLEGSTLRHLLEHGPIPLRKAIDYAMQIAHGLAAAYEQGIIHRDLKPENLFVTKDGRVKILDFGLAKLIQRPAASDSDGPTLTEGTEPGIVMGTAGYMSPEQVRGTEVDHRSDIFAFGAILYEMLSGGRAFRKPTSAETMSAILNEDPPDLSQFAPSVPPALQRIVHRCMEKSPTQRFHSASDLAFALEALSDSGSSQSAALAARPKRRIPWLWIAAGGLAAVLIAAFAVWWWTPPPVPYVDQVIQLTSDGQGKGGDVVTDGSRIYFNEGEQGNRKIAQVSVNGGPTALIDTRLVNPQILSLAPDNSSLLVATGDITEHGVPLWSVPLPAGEPRRLGDQTAYGAGYFPDDRILVSRDGGIYSAETDGSQSHLILPTKDFYVFPTSAPDGKHLAFTRFTEHPPSQAVYLSTVDGKELRAVPKDRDSLWECCAAWTSDGNGLIFQVVDRLARNKNNADLWYIPAYPRLFHPSPQPVRLTNGELSYNPTNVPALSRDGNVIYAIGATSRGELNRFDKKSQQFVPFLSGISATDPTFSQDGQWVAYLSYPDYALWRSRADGTDRMQLTQPPLVPSGPAISPDGQQVVFSAGEGDSSFGDIYVVGTDGSPPRRIVHGNAWTESWSPDGNFLVLNSWTGDGMAPSDNFLETYDIHTGKRATVPSSQGMMCARWADQNTLVACVDPTSGPTTASRTFNFKTGKWKDLSNPTSGFVNWAVTLDRKYLYAVTGAPDALLLRIRLSDGHVETIASLRNFRNLVSPIESNTRINAAPDGSAVFTRDIGTEEIYALKLRWR